jgi:hypothetical protein
MRKTGLTIGVTIVALLGMGPGCESIESVVSGNSSSSAPKPGTFVQVDVPRADDSGTVPVLIEKNIGDANHELAISRMQTSQYSDAAQLLRDGLADNKPQDKASSSEKVKYMREHLALAVCLEMQDEYEEAQQQYILANDRYSDTRPQLGAKRCAEKAGL